jgi:hypothetical protein
MSMDYHELKINTNCVQIVSKFDGKHTYTIWADSYDMFREAFKKSEQYEKEQAKLEKKYENALKKVK